MAEKLIPLIVIGACCCACICSLAVGGAYTCTNGSFESLEYDSSACLKLPDDTGPSPGPSGEEESKLPSFPDDIPGLTGRYQTTSYTSDTVWTDTSGKDNHAVVEGGRLKTRLRDETTVPLISGEHTVSVKFPVECLDNPNGDYTLAYVGKYAGEKRGRIFDGVGVNWLSGWHGNRSGYAYHGAGEWLTEYTVNDGKYGQALIMGVDQKNVFRCNGKNVTKIGYTNGQAPTSITINGGMAKEGNWGGDGEVSDFALGEVLIYNRELSDTEMKRVETYLQGNYFREIQTEAQLIATGWRRGEPGAKSGDAFEPIKAMHELSGNQEDCRVIAEKEGKAVWGHRNEAHPQQEWRNTCFFYDTTDNFDGYVDDTSDSVHTMGCADPTKDVHTGCQ